MPPSSRTADLSVILPTDTYETIQPVLEKLRRQTVASRIEVILVAPTAEAVAEARAHEPDFGALRIIETSSLSPLGGPRAAGIRAAAAPLIFVGETHSYLHPDAAERLIAAAVAGPWAVVTPGFENANPGGLCSWSGFLVDYGRWSASQPAGEIPEPPLYDSIYRRDVLLEMGDRLEQMLSYGDDLRLALQARGHRAYFEPAARIDHLNIETPAAWLHVRYLTGVLIGSRRARHWPWWRRLAYIAGAGLIPAVLLWRVWPGVRKTARAQRLPAGTFPAIVLLFMAKAAGELVGYAGGGSSREEKTMNHYEVRRVDYVA